LGVTQQTVSVRLSHGNDSKTRKLPYELKPRDVEKRFFTCEQLIQRQQRKGFFASDCDWRSGYSTTTPRRKNIMLSPINRCHRPQHQYGRIFMIRRSCSVSGGTKRVLLILDELLKPGDSIIYWAIGIDYN